MLKLVIIGTIATFVAATHPINENIVKDIRSKTRSWRAHEPSQNPIKNWTMEEIKARLGTIVQGPVEGIPEPAQHNDIVPKTFDSRE